MQPACSTQNATAFVSSLLPDRGDETYRAREDLILEGAMLKNLRGGIRVPVFSVRLTFLEIDINWHINFQELFLSSLTDCPTLNIHCCAAELHLALV